MPTHDEFWPAYEGWGDDDEDLRDRVEEQYNADLMHGGDL